MADRTPQPPASRTGPSGPPWHRSRRVNTLNHLSKKYRAVQPHRARSGWINRSRCLPWLCTLRNNRRTFCTSSPHWHILLRRTVSCRLHALCSRPACRSQRIVWGAWPFTQILWIHWYGIGEEAQDDFPLETSSPMSRIQAYDPLSTAKSSYLNLFFSFF